MNKFLKVAWFTTKVGLGGGIVYITVDQGVFGNSHTTAATYDKLYGIMPGTKTVAEKLPKKDDVNVNFRSHWNTGIFYTFDFLANLPGKVGSLKDYTVDLLTPAPAPAPAPPESSDGSDAKQEEKAPEPEAVPVEETSPSPPPPAPPAEENPPAAVEEVVTTEGSGDGDKKEE
ncbi:uncharacterized protein LOC143031518 [Oratosquilla oratoria]|uniref:uncharacterized protein LOC143031518 n=1 Tax=Oratosquilla oratoria TaxID=337810 RepID=UPI003F76299E